MKKMWVWFHSLTATMLVASTAMAQDSASNQEDVGMFAALAPDDLHKDNTSGGDPYGLLLPCPAADFEFINERHGLLFVPYLRLAVLRWGGFPGLEGREEESPLLSELTAGLEPF